MGPSDFTPGSFPAAHKSCRESLSLFVASLLLDFASVICLKTKTNCGIFIVLAGLSRRTTKEIDVMKTSLSASLCAFGAVLGFAFSASAAETIAYWPFGTNGFHDVSGNGHDLVGTNVVESDAAYVSLNPGTTTGQFLQTANALDLSGETAVTFECWWRKTAAYNANEYPMLMAAAHVGANDLGGFIVCQYNNADGVIRSQYRTAANSWQLDHTATNDTLFVGGKVNDGMWHHVAYVVNRAETTKARQCRLYVDGVEVAKAGVWNTEPDVVPALFNDYFVIGGGTDYSSSISWHGYIDDVRISRGALTPESFLKYPTVGKAMRADDGKLPVLAYWPFGGKRNKDVTGNGFDLVSSNVFFTSSCCANTTWATRANEFTCSPSQTVPFSAFSKTGLTVEMFVKSDSSSKLIGMLMETGSAYWGGTGAFRISFDANNSGYTTIFSGYHVSGSYGAYSQTTEEEFGDLGDGKWRHLAMVYDPKKQGAGIVTLYIDGVPATCSTESGNANQGAFALGDLPLYLFRRANKQIGDEAAAFPFYGNLDDVRITGAALTPDKFLANRSETSVVALYRFDQGTTEDVSGNGQSLTFEGGTPVIELTSGYSGCNYYGLKMDGALRFHTTDPVDLADAKAMTVEFDYNRKWNGDVYAMAASEDVWSLAGSFTFYRTGTALQAQCRLEDNAGWAFVQSLTKSGDATSTGFYGGRFSYDANVSPVSFNLNVDGANKSTTPTVTVGNIVNQKMYFGGCPTYPNRDDSTNKRFTGYFYRIAISDVKLDPADYVLDNLPPEPETNKHALAYWDFKGFDDKSGAGIDLGVSEGCRRRKGALVLDGNSSAVTDDTLYLADLTQATIECFVCFGETPSSGTLFSLGSGVGSFAVAVTNAALTGSFIPYDHLAASNGGTTPIAPLAGKKTWHHVALVIDRTKSGADAVRFYVDYERVMPAGRAWDKSATMLDGTLVVGADSTREGGFFTGRIDDLRVSAGALEPNEFIQASARTEMPDGTHISLR